jgi:hypothetical protein
MSWRQILLVTGGVLLISGSLTFLVRLSLIQSFGKHMYDRSFGRGVTEQTYALDQKARRPVRWGTAIAFVLLLACTGSCAWWAISHGIPLPE